MYYNVLENDPDLMSPTQSASIAPGQAIYSRGPSVQGSKWTKTALGLVWLCVGGSSKLPLALTRNYVKIILKKSPTGHTHSFINNNLAVCSSCCEASQKK